MFEACVRAFVCIFNIGIFFGSVIHCICYSIYSKNGFMLLLVFEWTKKSVCIAIFQMETYDAEEHTNFQHKDKKNECARERERKTRRMAGGCVELRRHFHSLHFMMIFFWCFFQCLWHSAIACLFFGSCVFQNSASTTRSMMLLAAR